MHQYRVANGNRGTTPMQDGSNGETVYGSGGVGSLWELCTFCSVFLFFKKDFLYLFLERGERREEGRGKERERNINVWLPLMHPLVGPGQ